MLKSSTRARLCSLPILGLLGAMSAFGGTFTLVYTDTFTTQDALYAASATTPTNFTQNTPFSLVATFDTSKPDFHFPPGGFNAYTPIADTLMIGTKSYTITNADVAIFDSTNVFTPGHYAVGMIENPAQDESGFVADFSGASPGFSVNNIAPTMFTGYNGTGFQPGAGTPAGCGGACTGYLNQPLTLTGADGMSYLLVLGARDSDPSPAASADITFSPEPAALWLVAGGITALGVWKRRKR